jgi:hypothetical protein
MPGSDVPEGKWDDARIAGAYRDLTAGSTPPDLEATTLRAVRSSGAGPSAGWRPRFLRVRLRLGGLAAAVAVVSIVAVTLSLQPWSATAPTASSSASSSAATQPGMTPAPTSTSGRYPGGIPTTIGGESVYVSYAAVAHADDTTDDTPFLVGMWSYDFSTDHNLWCSPPAPDPSPDNAEVTLAYSGLCSPGLAGPEPEAYGVQSSLATLGWNVQTRPSGPLVLRVHTHDALAAQCRAADQSVCETAMVVDEVVWSGDAWTQTDPVSVAQAVRRLTTVAVSFLSTSPFPLFVVNHANECRSPWPHEVFDVRGDSRFGLLAVFPDVASRQAAQASLDSASPTCSPDSRIARPGAAAWVGVDNMLALVYGDVSVVTAATAALQTPTTSPLSPEAVLPAPSVSAADSYAVVADYELGRQEALLDVNFPGQASGNWDAYQADALRRFRANALSFTIGPAQPATEALVGAKVWAAVAPAADTARVYEVDHPDSTDPALASELVLCYRADGRWETYIVKAAPYPSVHP